MIKLKTIYLFAFFKQKCAYMMDAQAIIADLLYVHVLMFLIIIDKCNFFCGMYKKLNFSTDTKYS